MCSWLLTLFPNSGALVALLAQRGGVIDNSWGNYKFKGLYIGNCRFKYKIPEVNYRLKRL